MFFAGSSFDFAVGLDDVAESDEISQSSEDLFASIGAAIHFTDNFAASLDFTLFKDVGEEFDTDVDSLALGVQYTF